MSPQFDPSAIEVPCEPLAAMRRLAQEPPTEGELRDLLQSLTLTVWDLFRHSRVPSQWEALREITAEAVKALQRAEGRAPRCSAPEVPEWIRQEWDRWLREAA